MKKFLWPLLALFINTTQLLGAAMNETYTVGYFRVSFMRDPLLYNFFEEHMSVSQVLETLITTNAHGDLAPCIADKWDVLEGGKTYRFYLRKDAFFSNGAPILAEDVKYSLDRHIHSTTSQSSPFLQDIESLIVVAPRVLDVKLKRPRVSIFKVLTRDQLGIVPKDWTFRDDSPEPFVASGPYRLKRVGKDFYFEKNAYFFDKDTVPDIRWKGLTFDDLAAGKLPDLAIMVRRDEFEVMVKKYKIQLEDYVVENLNSFGQVSALWAPRGKDFQNDAMRNAKMRIMDELVTEVARNRSLVPATGIIPKGIAGYLNQRLPLADAPQPFKTTEDIAIDTLKNVTDLIDRDILSALEKKYNVRFKFRDLVIKAVDEKYDPKSDIVLVGWAGGFSDPEGFLPVLPKILRQDLDTYFSNIPKAHEAYKKAIYEQDWTRRSEIFREFNRALTESSYYVPGWRTDTLFVHGKNFVKANDSYRYSPRVTDFKLKDR